MESRQLGRTGLRVSRLGYGLAGIMQRERRGEDISAAGRVLEAVLESGINFLDSAAAYGSTEQIIGNSIAHRRDEFILATKFGADVGRGRAPFTAELIAASVDRSLRRMKTDHLDVLQLHSPEPHHDLMTLDRDLIVEAMLRAKEAGKTRYLGYSGDNEAAQWAVASGAFDTLQTSFNLVDQHARAGLLASAKAKDMGIIIKRPIAMGMWGTGAPTHGNYTYEAYVERVQAMQQAGPVPAAPDDPIESSCSRAARWCCGRSAPTWPHRSPAAGIPLRSSADPGQ